MNEIDPLIQSLALQAISLSGNQSTEIERSCWMIVHEHIHGVKPVE